MDLWSNHNTWHVDRSKGIISTRDGDNRREELLFGSVVVEGVEQCTFYELTIKKHHQKENNEDLSGISPPIKGNYVFSFTGKSVLIAVYVKLQSANKQENLHIRKVKSGKEVRKRISFHSIFLILNHSEMCFTCSL